jgi:hypothetical protein
MNLNSYHKYLEKTINAWLAEFIIALLSQVENQKDSKRLLRKS